MTKSDTQDTKGGGRIRISPPFLFRRGTNGSSDRIIAGYRCLACGGVEGDEEIGSGIPLSCAEFSYLI